MAIPAAPADREIRKTALLVWEEHCVECAIPECYTTCPLYVRRVDQKCARLVYGMYPNPAVRGLFGHGADVRFRRWGKIETEWNTRPRIIDVSRARSYARIENLVARTASWMSDLLQPVNPKRRLNGLHAYLRRRWLKQPPAKDESGRPNGFYVKFFSPERAQNHLVIEVYQGRPVFRESIAFEHGWTEAVIPFDRMNIDLDKPARVFVRPADDREVRVIFTWLDFVEFVERPAAVPAPAAGSAETAAPKPAAKVKCVVWDLDNTLWDGVIGDDGPDAVRPRPLAIEMIKKLDERGILLSVASKNNYDIAWKKLEQLGLADYFLYPAIHWGPKSQSLVAIANELNINVDTFAFIDDSPFERAEVQASLPQVRVYDAIETGSILTKPELDVPVTEAAKGRRLSYLAESQRKQVAANWGNDYEGFLRSCGMVMRIQRPTDTQQARCLELIHRTNQLNLSTRRYDAAEFSGLLADENVECFALECVDRFGDYGLVGFVSADVGDAAPVLRDFVLSCRVAQKGVEEAFVLWFAHRARERGAPTLRAALVATDRNKPLRDTFDRLPFTVVAEDGKRKTLEMSLAEVVVVPDLVRIEEGLELREATQRA